MRSYCSVPPLAGAGVKPNLLLMIDNSASMYDPAYTDPSTYCLDDSYNNVSEYVGYFDQKSLYSYTFKKDADGKDSSYFEVAASQTLPAQSLCNSGRAEYLCVNNSAGQIDRFVASGNFLNWLAMSKLDIEKGTLTGGKFDSATGLLQAETRGCQGKRFIKMPGNLELTFAVRGPLPDESGYSATRGGLTRIELYPKRYKKEACLAAVTAWQGGTPQKFRDAVIGCLDLQWDPDWGEGWPSKEKILVDALSVCHSYHTGGILAVEEYNEDSTKLNISPLLDDCTARLKDIYNSDPGELLAEGAGDAICGSGFYGSCYEAATGFQKPDCEINETVRYCSSVANPPPIDPSATANKAGTSANVPGFVLDTGVANLGSASLTLLARIAPVSAPAGLIQEFDDQINYGAMVFNDSGNGGKIISYLNDPAFPLGDHRTGLIAAIDGVTGGSWTPLAGSFYEAIGYFSNRPALRLQAEDFTKANPPSQFSCQRNNILMLTDGVSTADRVKAVNDFVAAGVTAWVNDADGMPAGKTTTSTDAASADPPNQGSYNLDDLAWIARHKNIFNADNPIQETKDYLTTYVVYTGVPCSDSDADGSCKTSNEAVPEKMMQLTAAKGGGKIAKAQKPADLRKAVGDMLQHIAAGTGAEVSILSSGEGNGAIFLQEQFYPTRSFDGGKTSVSWIGEMRSLWYYIDPFIGRTAGAGSAIREDTLDEQKLDLKDDKIVSLRFDPASKRTYAYLTADSNGDGIGDGAETKVDVDQVKTLWRAGEKLWKRDLTASPRTIYTPVLKEGTELNGSGLMKFDWNAPDAVAPYLNLQPGDPGAVQLIKYLHGFDFSEDSSMRSRTVAIDASPETVADPEKGVGVWKLGDIISSTPQVQSAVPLGGYNLASPKGYNDGSYARFLGLQDPYPSPVDYKRRGMVYVGANDGMLHAFKLGELGAASSEALKATLTGTDLGKEQWAFIPKHLLPYLKYLRDPNYRHLYYVDGKITLIDASIGDFNGGSCTKSAYWNCPKTTYLPDSSQPDPTKNTWRTVLIGATGLGGASCLTGENCVPTPLADPEDSAKRVGYSSYFALDVTDPESPELLWEFSHPDLGYSTTGPAIVRIKDPGTNGNDDLNGRWFAVFGSGPTGPIDNYSHQFLGRSGQKLKFFIVDLRTGTLEKTIDTQIADAFAGSMIGGAIDADKWKASDPGNYQDDAIYVGYSMKSSSTGAWTDGGVIRILTKESLYPNGSNAWDWSSVIAGIGPVTTGIARLQDRRYHNLWLYFGTGRYFYSQDDMAPQRALYGVKEPCYNYKAMGVDSKRDRIEPGCSAAVNAGDLVDQTETRTLYSIDPDDPGWRIDLDRDADPAKSGVGAERLITNPTSITGGAVFFTTFRPKTDACLLGDSYLWGVKYDTGGPMAESLLQGKVLVRLATGGLQETGLSGNLSARDGRRSAMPMTGKAGGARLVSNSGLKPLKKIIHIQER